MQDGSFPFKCVDPPPTDSAVYRWGELVVEGRAKTGRPWTNVPNYATWFREIGFVDVAEKQFYWRTSPWPKGQYFKELGVL
jgi:hypothetical protein